VIDPTALFAHRPSGLGSDADPMIGECSRQETSKWRFLDPDRFDRSIRAG
jgi:hypothetical protein